MLIGGKYMNINEWSMDRFGVDVNTLIEALNMSPSAQGYIHRSFIRNITSIIS